VRIVCPACSATYDVPSALLQPAGRKVKCARCGKSWSPGATPEPPARSRLIAQLPEIDVTPVEPPLSRDAGRPLARPVAEASARLVPARGGAGAQQAREAAPSSGVAAVLVGWMLTVLVIAAAGYGAYTYRPQIEAAWPPSQRAYALLGIR
jgi:predicted Zn finger-like uncharacterized protein